jgi:hypothetical protein
MTSIHRGRDLYGAKGKIGVSRTVFYTDIVERPGKTFIPGTDIPRLKAVRLGDRAKGYLSDEVDGLIEALRRERDHPPRPRGRRKREVEEAAAR